MSPWTDRLDQQGHPHTSVHIDGHKVGLFPDGVWWAYHKDHRWAPPKAPPIGPEPAGPFTTLDEAKRVVESQGFDSILPFERTA